MKRRMIMIGMALTFVLCLVIIGCGRKSEADNNVIDNKDEGNSYKSISMSEAEEMMKNEKDYIILDVRTAEEYKEGHIPNAINVANETIGEDEISELPNKDQLIMVYCRSGRRSKQAASKLVKLGYSNIVEIGGIIDWKGDIEK